MANRWGNNGNRDRLYFGGFQNHGDCSHEIKRCLLLWRKAMANLDSILKSRDITLLTKVHLVKAMVFLVVFWGLPYSSDGEESACNEGEAGSIPGSGRSPGEGNGNPLQYSCLGNPMDRGAWHATVLHSVAKSRTWLSEHTRSFHYMSVNVCFQLWQI